MAAASVDASRSIYMSLNPVAKATRRGVLLSHGPQLGPPAALDLNAVVVIGLLTIDDSLNQIALNTKYL